MKLPLTIILPMLVMGGCHGPLNSSVSPGLSDATLPIFADSTPTEWSTEPSLTAGFDRAHWNTTTIKVSTGTVEHDPIDNIAGRLGGSMRHGGRYPTASSALDTKWYSSSATCQSGRESLVTLGSIILTPIRIMIEGRKEVARSSGHDWDRLPATTSH